MQVKALVRQREGAASDAIPPAVEVVVGDIGDLEACKRAVQGVDKVRPEDVGLWGTHACNRVWQGVDKARLEGLGL